MKRVLSICLITLLIICTTACEERPTEVRDIKGLKLSSNITEYSDGGFVLGVGTYKSDEVITTKYYLYIRGQEGFKLQEIDSGNLEIVETNEKSPCIKGKFYGDGTPIVVFDDCIVYVPVGTIFEEYDANLSNIK